MNDPASFSLPALSRLFSSAVPLRVLLILVVGLVALRLSRKALAMLRGYFTNRSRDSEASKRIETVMRAVRYALSTVITIIVATLVLTELGISIAPILGAAGVVGLAVGFGAQSLIRDYFNGFFLLLENQIHLGDVVEVGGKSGQVEEVTLRYVRLRDYSGSVHYVPNGLITTVTNRSRDHAFAVIDVGVAYREEVDAVFAVMREVAAELRRDEAFRDRILEDMELSGVNEWADSALMIRARIKVVPLEQWNVRREYLRRLKKAFDLAGIEIPLPHLSVYAGNLRRGEGSPFRLLPRDGAPGE